MKYIITESQYNLISELERNWMDAEYSDEYEKIKEPLIELISNIADGYYEDDKRIEVYNKRKAHIMSYNKLSGELFYNSSIDDKYSKLFPHPLWTIHRKYLVADAFESLFDKHEVKRVRFANFG